MKKYLWILMIIAVAGDHMSRAYDQMPVHSTGTTVFCPIRYWQPYKSRMVFLGNTNREILVIDQEGDIFLRGKWIGCDHRLTKSLFVREAVK